MGNGRNSAKSVSKSAVLKYQDKKDVQQQISQSTATDKHYKMSVGDFQKLSIDEAAKFMNKMESEISDNDLRAMGLNSKGNFFQKTIVALGLHDKPLVLSDKDFDKVAKSENALLLYRGMGDSDAVDNTKYADTFFTGGGSHGHGIYLTTSKSTARQYGYRKDWNNKDAGFTAFIDKSKAKVITENDLRTMRNNESPEVYKAFAKNGGLSSYAVYKGYNVIHVPGGNFGPHNKRTTGPTGGVRGEDFYVPLTRGVLVIRENMKMRKSKP